jgi:WD40 repeat protein
LTVAFTPDGKSLAAGSDDKIVRFWDLDSGTETRRFTAAHSVQQLAFAPGGTLLALGEGMSIGELRAGEAHPSVIELWDLAKGLVRHRLTCADVVIAPLAFSPDGKVLASTGTSGKICLWDPASGQELRSWRAHPSRGAVAFSPDGRALFSVGTTDCTIRRWDTATGKEIDPHGGHTLGVHALHFSRDGKMLISQSTDAKTLEWDVAKANIRRQLLAPVAAPTDEPQHLAADLAPDGKSIAVALADTNKKAKGGTLIHVLEAGSGKTRSTLPGQAEGLVAIKFAPEGQRLALVAKNRTEVWDWLAGKQLFSIDASGPFAFARYGRLFAYASSDRTITLGDAATGGSLFRWDSRQLNLSGLSLSPDGKVLASVSSERNDVHEVRVWDPTTRALIAKFDSKWPGGIHRLAFSPSGRILAAAVWVSRDVDVFTIELWEIATGQTIRQIVTPQRPVLSLAFAPDGRVLASGGQESTILLWDLTAQAERPNSKGASLTAQELEKLWTDLAGAAAVAERAIWALADSPKSSLPLFKARLEAVAPADRKRISQLLEDLDSTQFAVRDKATKALVQMGEAAERAIRKVLASSPSLETRLRLERILTLSKSGDQKEVIRKLRAIETLEHIGTSAARRLLEAIERDASNYKVADAAAGALGRLP